VDPETGREVSLIMPYVNTECMNIYLQYLAQEITGKFTLIMDGAGWHKSKDLKVPDNISILLLPPYSPELNPVERLWEFIKSKVLKNKVYDDLSDLEDKLCEFIRGMSGEDIKSICNV
jgi:transposase